MKKKVGIFDYGAGNLKSVIQAFNYLGYNTVVVENTKESKDYSHILLPGVGSFSYAMEELEKRGMRNKIINASERGIPIFGICLGMQILGTRGSEDVETNGLQLIEGDVDKFCMDEKNAGIKIPNVGFCSVEKVKNSRILKNIDKTCDYYFTHSYRMICRKNSNVIGISNHGENYAAIIEEGAVIGTQFHPEKSQTNGLKILKNFMEEY